MRSRAERPEIGIIAGGKTCNDTNKNATAGAEHKTIASVRIRFPENISNNSWRGGTLFVYEFQYAAPGTCFCFRKEKQFSEFADQQVD